MPVNWALGLQQSNPGEAFAHAFQQGQKDREARVAKDAMAMLFKNPDDTSALAALARVDPEKAMEFRKQTLEYGGKTHAEWAKIVGLAAKEATTPEMWDQTVDQFVAAGHTEAAQLKGKFSPAARAALMAQGGIQDNNPPQDPGIIREFDEATKRGLVPPGMTFQQYVQMRNPGMSSPVNIPYGAQVTQGGDMPTVATPQDAARLPPGTQFRMPDGRIGTVPGGASGNAGGGFPQ